MGGEPGQRHMQRHARFDIGSNLVQLLTQHLGACAAGHHLQRRHQGNAGPQQGCQLPCCLRQSARPNRIGTRPPQALQAGHFDALSAQLRAGQRGVLGLHLPLDPGPVRGVPVPLKGGQRLCGGLTCGHDDSRVAASTSSREVTPARTWRKPAWRRLATPSRWACRTKA